MSTNNTRAIHSMALKKHQTIVIALILALVPILGVSPASADDQGGAYGGGYGRGYSGPGPALMTVAEAKGQHDDAWVALKGNITKSLGGKHYEFTDATGSITVEISGRSWMGQTIGPDDLVEIYGELDKDWSKVEIEVKRINKL